MNENGQRRKREEPSNMALPALADLGVTKMQSSRWQKLAALPEVEREKKIDNAKQKASGVERFPVHQHYLAHRDRPRPRLDKAIDQQRILPWRQNFRLA
jgi:hypothetical protein